CARVYAVTVSFELW
nr:immunoglobulin heavy chain junction region [Macaca mulatta]MOV38026.1 immunoglobulin heavy chain junction region [Macaca mulatta]MOV38129.1 immunoglobulin heavy chain junction region [Macaca mulatta]MOV39096.1 immunoglobulin heavy chain junction region [Macaca mulatta]MOV40252.1 immunoglobulin heavy chain junction region [Macaca mulatta]